MPVTASVSEWTIFENLVFIGDDTRVDPAEVFMDTAVVLIAKTNPLKGGASV
jgi:hypothetical protein